MTLIGIQDAAYWFLSTAAHTVAAKLLPRVHSLPMAIAATFVMLPQHRLCTCSELT